MNSSKDIDTIVLSGGSTKGILLLGALHFLYEIKLISDISNYVGTSVGSIICYLLIIGFEPLELQFELFNSKIFSLFKTPNIFGLIQNDGVFKFEPIRNELERLTLIKLQTIPTMKDLKKNLYITTYNLTDETLETITNVTHPDLSCIDALQMAASMPLIFKPFVQNDKIYIDGGIIDNFPITIACNIGNNIIGLNLINKSKLDINNILEFVLKLMFISINFNMKSNIKNIPKDKNCEIFEIESDMLFFEMNIDQNTSRDLFSIGYNNIKNHFQNIII